MSAVNDTQEQPASDDVRGWMNHAADLVQQRKTAEARCAALARALERAEERFETIFGTREQELVTQEAYFGLTEIRKLLAREALAAVPTREDDPLERIQALTDEIHAENVGGKHVTGFCEACAVAALVLQRAILMAAPTREEEP